MSNRLDDAAATLVTALTAKMGLPPDRIHANPPAQVVAPCVYLDEPTVAPEAAGTFGSVISASFPVRLIFDGADQPQRLAMRDGAARLWDALCSVPGAEVIDLHPETVDVGGPSSRSYVATVAYTISARTLCAPQLAEVS